MGCNQITKVDDETFMKPINLQLSSTLNLPEITLNHVNTIITSITNIHSKILSSFHTLVFRTGACVFKNPSLIHCMHCIFYLISSETEGSIENSGICYTEDLPYLTIDNEILSENTLSLLTLLFTFIINTHNYKTTIRNLDKETSELQYILHENKDNISKHDESVLNNSVELLSIVSDFRQKIMKQYNDEVAFYVSKNDAYCREIDYIGTIAHKKQIKDVYEIAMLMKGYKDIPKGKYVSEIQYDDEYYEMWDNKDSAKKEYMKKYNEFIIRDTNTEEAQCLCR